MFKIFYESILWVVLIQVIAAIMQRLIPHWNECFANISWYFIGYVAAVHCNKLNILLEKTR